VKNRQQRTEIDYNVYEWLGLRDDICTGPDACSRCGKLFMEGEKCAVFFTGEDELTALIRNDERLCVDDGVLCHECTIFWLTCLKSLGVKTRYYGEERLSLIHI